MKRRVGFTLIELLIVVAIIAILAAIAVPNFLEAQTRSKTSAAASDMRSVATALEAYYIDNNRYPYSETIAGAAWMVPGGMPIQNPSNYRMGGITSPIAYMTSVPPDPFKHGFDTPLVPVGPLYYEIAGVAMMNGVLTTARAVQVPADAVAEKSITGTGADTPITDPNETPRRWVLFSLGPDLENHLFDGGGNLISQSRYHLDNRYDPTNGTISKGNIIRYPGGESFPVR